GGNPGKPTEQGLYADGAAALAFLIGAGGVSPKKAAVLGESLGSGVAVKLASENDLGAVLLFAPFTSAADVAAEVYPYLPARQLILDRYPNLERMAKVSAPVFVFQGEADEIIPVAHGRRILDSVTGRKEGVFLPGIGHNDWPIGPSSGRAALFLKALE
ncbi:MAG: alpha/beta hydrolase, partial [Alphaproteobacteria bacterium]|nr:alpha/beta hydrolase [Alphaproteobacteria bacterium]